MSTTALLPVAARRSRRGWVLLVLLALAFIAALAIVGALASLQIEPVHIVIDGVDQGDVIDLAALASQHRLLLACLVTFALIAALVVVPLALLIAIGAVAFGLVVGIGVPLMLVLLFVAAVLSPLWLLALLVWWAWRRSGTPANIGA